MKAQVKLYRDKAGKLHTGTDIFFGTNHTSLNMSLVGSDQWEHIAWLTVDVPDQFAPRENNIVHISRRR